jgi:hypothetical protein
MSDEKIEIPPEFDTAIFTQGVKAKEAGQADDTNPFDPAFPHQFESWAAGYAAGVAPESVEPLVEPVAEDRSVPADYVKEGKSRKTKSHDTYSDE